MLLQCKLPINSCLNTVITYLYCIKYFYTYHKKVNFVRAGSNTFTFTIYKI